MTFATTSRPGRCLAARRRPTGPARRSALLAQYPWLHGLAGTPQDPHYHAGGRTPYPHAHYRRPALVALPAWQALTPLARAGAVRGGNLLHDVKPSRSALRSTARAASLSPRHARKGEQLRAPCSGAMPRSMAAFAFPYREQIAKLIRHHGLPLWFLGQRADPARAVVARKRVARLDHVALLAESRCARADKRPISAI